MFQVARAATAAVTGRAAGVREGRKWSARTSSSSPHRGRGVWHGREGEDWEDEGDNDGFELEADDSALGMAMGEGEARVRDLRRMLKVHLSISLVFTLSHS